MAVSVEEYPPGQRRQVEALTMRLHEFAEERHLRAEPLCVFIVRQHVLHLVAEHRRAARLEDDDGDARADLVADRVDHAEEHLLRERQEAVVVQRPPAADGTPRDDHLEARRLEQLHRRNRGLRMKVVVERVGPQKNGATGATGARANGATGAGRAGARGAERARTTRVPTTPGEPVGKRLRREGGNAPRLGHPRDQLGD